MYFAFKTYPGGGAFALFFHPHPREFATQNKKSANARGLARGGWAQLELTDALALPDNIHLISSSYFYGGILRMSKGTK